MKKVAGSLRLDLAQYRELAAFAKFGSDLDKATQIQLQRGSRLVEILKQGQYIPLPVEKQIVLIYAATKGFLDKQPESSLGRYESELYDFFENNYKELMKDIKEKAELTGSIAQNLENALIKFNQRFVAEE